MIGLSASHCIRDICRGIINLDEVEKVITGLYCPEQQGLENIIRAYKSTHWKEFPEQAEQIFRQLLIEGKIEMPRIKGGKAPDLTKGAHWVESETQVQYV